jgi:hypothetical protein
VIVVAPAGNQGITAITLHPWLIPVVTCDVLGRTMNEWNLGRSTLICLHRIHVGCRHKFDFKS